MWQKWTYLAVLVVALTLIAGPAAYAFGPGKDANLFGWWKLDDGGGTVAEDSSGNDFHGTLMNDPVWASGTLVGALEFDGVDDYVEVPHDEGLTVDTEVTVMAWINTERHQGPDGASWQGIIGKQEGQRSYSLYTYTTGALHFSTAGIGTTSDPIVPLNEWVHVCAMVKEGTHAYFINGDAAGTGGSGISLPGTADTANVVIGRTNEGTSRSFLGFIDDVRLYNRALTQEEVQIAMGGEPVTTARDPYPADGQTDVRRDVVMSWTAGEYAATHDVYFGTAVEDVNSASRSNPMGVLVSQGQTATEYDADELLEIGQTYYWRIDEVNATPDTIFKGQVWSFTAEPFAYPVEGVVATSNMSATTGLAPDALVDGSGLDQNDQHSTDTAEMWVGVPDGDETPYIQFEFDRTYKIQEMLVWNYNMAFETFLGVGIKNATIEYSEDGQAWTTLSDVELTQGPGASTCTSQAVVLDGVAAKYLRLRINDNFGTTDQFGLSEVRFLYLPVLAREPEPADGATNVDVTTALGWRGGREAVIHEVYLSQDEAAVTDGTALVGTSNAVSYVPSDIEYGSTYYWKITEVNDAETITAWAGDTWSFSTAEYAVIDDFESYVDDESQGGQAIWSAWIDGLVQFGGDAANGGSQVGHDTSPFAEQTIVHTGSQSMPLYFNNNSTSAISEADYAFASTQDWTTNGIKSLSLWFYGDAGNSGQLYVKINETKVVYGGDAGDITRTMWQPWNIDLAPTGANLNGVSTLSIGVQGSGSGVLYIDDVRLYAKETETIESVQPGAENLVAHYTFEGNVNDSSGEGHNGTIAGSPTYVTGYVNQAIALDGANDYVTVDSVGIDPCEPRTIAGWAKSDIVPTTGWANIFGFTSASGNGQHFDIEWVGDSGSNATLGYYGLHRYGWERNIMPVVVGEWHHLAAAFDGETISWYGDGQLVGSQVLDDTIPAVIPVGTFNMGKRQDNEVFFAGSIDDVRVYNVGLSIGEIAGLAGRTGTSYVPF